MSSNTGIALTGVGPAESMFNKMVNRLNTSKKGQLLVNDSMTN